MVAYMFVYCRVTNNRNGISPKIRKIRMGIIYICRHGEFRNKERGCHNKNGFELVFNQEACAFNLANQNG
jgi:hypothetical protein